MKKKDKATHWNKHEIWLGVLFVLISVLIIFGTLIFGIGYSLREAQKTMDRNIADLKKQCQNYSDFLASDEAKSLIRLTEQTENVSETLALLDENRRQDYINSIFDIQRLDCILILDETLKPDDSLKPTGRHITAVTVYEEWATEVQSPAVRSILNQPKKVYSARIQHKSNTYDIAAVARTDADGIVFCAVRQNEDKLDHYYEPVRNLLARNETRLKGTLYIAEGERILASNKDSVEYRTIAEVTELQALVRSQAGNVLTRFTNKSGIYYGGTAKCRNYDIFVFYSAKDVYLPCRTIILVVICLYALTIIVIGVFYFKQKTNHNNEINRQHEIIDAISHIYSLTALLDLKTKHYELLKCPPDLDNVAKNGPLDTQFCKKIIGYVDENFRTDYRSFFDAETLPERLAGTEYVEYEYRDRAGEWLNDQLIVHGKDKDGRVDSVVFVRKSINVQKKTELEYQAKLEAAIISEQKANQSKTDFLRRMSHDIRTPINVILGMLEIGSRNPTDTELLTSCRIKVKTAADYLLELVNDILTLNKADMKSGDDIPTTEVFRLSEEVRKLYLIAAEQAKGYDGVTLEPPQFSGEDKPLVGESLYLRQIMINIITNAIRYSKKGGTVRFSVSQNPAQNRDGYAEVHFVCEDNGIGMSKEFQKSMFEPFAQENAVSVSRFGGVGLGLSIVQKLVNRLNGTIEVDSEQGRGTRFEIKIPYPYADAPDKAEPQAEAPASLAGITLLIVEDNELNMEIAEFMATESGAKVIRAFDGRQAIEKFAASAVGEIDVILTDVMMPEMDGLEETRRIRALDRSDAKTVPVIAMTANLFEEDIREYTNAGVTGVLPKPLNIDQLIETVTKKITKKGKSDG